MLRPVSSKPWENNNNSSSASLAITEEADQFRAEEDHADNFEGIFCLLGKALKCIRVHQLKSVKELGVQSIQRSYEEIAREIRVLRTEDQVDGARAARLIERYNKLAEAPLATVSKIEGYVKLVWIYRQLRELYEQELSCICPSESISSAAVTSKGVENYYPSGNFLGLLEEDPVQRTRLKELSVGLYSVLNEKMREVFDQSVDWIKKQIGSNVFPRCFICFNTGEKDVVRWLNEILIPDLKKIGVFPICSKQYLAAGLDLEEFQARAGKEDFAVVLCTPDLYRKYLHKPQSGIAVEIGHMQGRFAHRKGTTIPLLLKRESGQDPNEVNPFKDHPENPFAVLAPLNNYAGVLELFVTLLNASGPLKMHRALAQEGIKKIGSEGVRILDSLLDQQFEAARSAFFEACFPVVHANSASPLNLLLVYDDQSLTDRWLKEHLCKVLTRLGVHFEYRSAKSSDLTSAMSGSDFTLMVQTKVSAEGQGKVTVGVGKSADIYKRANALQFFVKGNWEMGELVELVQNYQFEISSKEQYFHSFLKMFSTMMEIDVTQIWNEFEKNKDEKIRSMAAAFAHQKQEVQFDETTRDRFLAILRTDVGVAKEGQPETISIRLISAYHKLSEYCLRKGDYGIAKKMIAEAARWSMHKHGPQDKLTLFYRSELGRVCYRLRQFDEAIIAYKAVLECQEDCYEARQRLGRLYHISGQTDLAEENMLLALTLPEANAGARVEYANFLLRNKREEEAIGCLMQIVSNLDDESTVAFQEADRSILPDGIDSMVEVFNNITLSSFHLACYLLIMAYIETGQMDQALSASAQFAEAVALKPSSLSYTLLGYSCVLLGKIPEAKQAFQQALELNPSNKVAQLNLE